MGHRYFFTRRGDLEDVLHIGESTTLVGFRSDPRIAAALAEMKILSGQLAVSNELSASEFDRLADSAAIEKLLIEAAHSARVAFDI